MSGALQSVEPSPTRTITPIARQNIDTIKDPTRVRAAPNCICRTTIPGAERYRGHYHAVNGLGAREGKLYFDCVRLCSENLGEVVRIEFSLLEKQCPKLVSFHLA